MNNENRETFTKCKKLFYLSQGLRPWTKQTKTSENYSTGDFFSRRLPFPDFGMELAKYAPTWVHLSVFATSTL
jgi:hypothetical protein